VSNRLHPAVRPPHPLIFAHRGGCALAPENTIAAFDRGLQAGADGLELDVRLAHDGVPVVHHDVDLDRCTDGTGPLSAKTAAELARVDAGHRFGPDGRSLWRGRGVRIPTLDEVLRRYPRIPLIVEIKTYSGDAAHAVVRCIVDAGALPSVCVAAFDIETLRIIRELAPTLATSAAQREVRSAMYGSWVGLRPRRPAYRAVQVPEGSGRLRVVSPRFIRAVHGAGVPIQVWTVNREDDMRRLFDWGVDGLITDRPDLAVDVRNAWLRRRHP
jgi:glycerophosphoryl diester phosphodiesterase